MQKMGRTPFDHIKAWKSWLLVALLWNSLWICLVLGVDPSAWIVKEVIVQDEEEIQDFVSNGILVCFDQRMVSKGLLQARIKKIMQKDEDVGKIALATPILICITPCCVVMFSCVRSIHFIIISFLSLIMIKLNAWSCF